MKRIRYVLLALFIIGAVSCSAKRTCRVCRSTMCYAVKGGDSLLMDRYTTVKKAKVKEARPCLIFLFGGGFTGGDRRAPQYADFFDHMALQGCDVLSIDYRTGLKDASAADFASPEAFARKLVGAIRLAVDDLYSATRYAVEQSGEWGLDPEQILVMGSSAGAITVLQGEYMRCNGDQQAAMLPEGFRYAGVISLAGAIFHLGEGLEWQERPAPMLLFHGNADRNVPYDAVLLPGAGFFGSQYIARSLTAKEAPHWFYAIRGADHVVAESPMEKHRQEIEEFIRRYVKEQSRNMLRTEERRPGTEEQEYNFTIADYIQQNYGTSSAQ